MDTIPAIRITQAGVRAESPVEIFVTAMTLRQLRDHHRIDTWSPSNSEGYQRPSEHRRLREVARYVLEQEGILPTSILLGTRPADEPRIEANGFSNDPVSTGTLALPDGSRLWVVDGQHRFLGVNDAYERDGEASLATYLFPVAIMKEVDQYAEMKLFNIINTRQKKMSTDIVDRHLVSIQDKVGLGMLSTGARGEKEYVRATATRIVDQLNDEPGPWYHQIAIPGVAGRDSGLIRQHAVVTAIEPFLKDSWVRGRTDADKVRVLANFWIAASMAWPEAFADPKSYRVQATAGVYSLHMALPVILQRCLESRDLTVDSMARTLRETGIDSEFWHKEDGNPLTLGTGMSSIRALAQLITERIASDAGEAVKL